MISSKAISTFRKKLNLLLLLLMLPLSLYAAELRVAYISDDDGYASIISDVLSVLSGEVTSEKTISSYWEEQEKREERAREGQESSLRTKEDFQALEKFMKEDGGSMKEESLISVIVSPSFSDEERAFLLSGDKDAFSYLMMRENLSLLIAASQREDGLMSESNVFINGEKAYSNLYVSSDEDGEFHLLLSALLPYFRDDNAAVVTLRVPGTVSVTVDGETVTPVRSTIVLEKGEHDLCFTSPVYETLEETVDIADGSIIEPELTEAPGKPMFISTLPYDAEIYYQGMRIDSHFIEEADVPFQLTAISDGFSALSVQSRLPMSRINMDLKPGWMDGVNVVENAKDRFYTNLLSTMISFGCFVAAQSLSGIYADAGLAPAVTLMAGVSVVGLVELLDSMFGYYQAAKLGL